MANNPLDNLLEAIERGNAELPPVGSGAAIAEDINLWPVGVDPDGREWCYTDGVIAQQARVEDMGRDLRPAGINHGVIRVDVLEPIDLVEVSDGNGGAVWMEVTR